MANTAETTTVITVAIVSRIITLTLIILWRSLLSPYDTSASINPTCLSLSSQSTQSPVRFPAISSAIERSIVWDSVYFVRIAECGYEYEQTYAFLPLLPLLISLISNSVFWPLVPLIGYRAVLALAGYVINNVAFVLAAFYFYRLSIVILKDQRASLRATVLFCFNPASIFYSSIYTESLYALTSIGGIYFLMAGANNFPVLLLALSGCARSNGVLNAGYYGFKALHQSYHAIYVKDRFLAVRVVLAGVIRCVCIFIPFLAFQAYGFYNICHGGDPDETRPWCRARVPLMYSFIQSRYWGVGFLRYFQVKQSPNFLLASPVLSLAFLSIYSYLKRKPKSFFTLGFGTASVEKESAGLLFPRVEELVRFDDVGATKLEAANLKQRRQSVTTQGAAKTLTESTVIVRNGYYSAVMLPFIYHLGFMAATAFFVMHVQVATRFLSASPPLYWFASYLMASVGPSKRWAYLIWDILPPISSLVVCFFQTSILLPDNRDFTTCFFFLARGAVVMDLWFYLSGFL